MGKKGKGRWEMVAREGLLKENAPVPKKLGRIRGNVAGMKPAFSNAAPCSKLANQTVSASRKAPHASSGFSPTTPPV